jgi:hypothetical protein
LRRLLGNSLPGLGLGVGKRRRSDTSVGFALSSQLLLPSKLGPFTFGHDSILGRPARSTAASGLLAIPTCLDGRQELRIILTLDRLIPLGILAIKALADMPVHVVNFVLSIGVSIGVGISVSVSISVDVN